MASAITSQPAASSSLNISKEEVSEIQLYSPKTNSLFSVRTDARVKTDKEIVVIMKASKDCDRNGASDDKIISPTIWSLCATKAIVVHEPLDEADFNNTIKKTHEVFNQKVQMVILCGHSDGDSIEFQKNFHFNEEHWWSSTSNYIKNKENGGGLVSFGCFTGRPHMLAQRLKDKVPVIISAPTRIAFAVTTFFLNNKAIFFDKSLYNAKSLSSVMETSWFLSEEDISPDPKWLDIISNNNKGLYGALKKNDLDLAYFINEQIEHAYVVMFGGEPTFNGHAHIRQFNQYYGYKCLLRFNTESKLHALHVILSRKQEEKKKALNPEASEKIEEEIQTLTKEVSELSTRVEKLNKSVSGEKIFEKLKNEMLEARCISERFILINSRERPFSILEAKKIKTFLSRIKKYLNLLKIDNSLEKLGVIDYMHKRLKHLNKLFRVKIKCLADKIHSLKQELKSLDESQQKEKIEKLQSLMRNEQIILAEVAEIQDKVLELQKILNSDQPSISSEAMAASV